MIMFVTNHTTFTVDQVHEMTPAELLGIMGETLAHIATLPQPDYTAAKAAVDLALSRLK